MLERLGCCRPALNRRILVAAASPTGHCRLMVICPLDEPVAPSRPAIIGPSLEPVLAVHQSKELLILIDSVLQRNNTILCGDEMNGLLLQLTQPAGEQLWPLNRRGQ